MNGCGKLALAVTYKSVTVQPASVESGLSGGANVASSCETPATWATGSASGTSARDGLRFLRALGEQSKPF